MAAERESIEISDKPELLRLVEEMEASGQPCVLRRNGKDVAVLRQIEAERGGPELTVNGVDDPLWGIVGLAQEFEDELDPDRPTDVSTNKHKYLAEAHSNLHDSE